MRLWNIAVRIKYRKWSRLHSLFLRTKTEMLYLASVGIREVGKYIGLSIPVIPCIDAAWRLGFNIAAAEFYTVERAALCLILQMRVHSHGIGGFLFSSITLRSDTTIWCISLCSRLRSQHRGIWSSWETISKCLCVTCWLPSEINTISRRSHYTA